MEFWKTDDNPADLPSRGLSGQDLKGSKPWWCGSEFLQYEEYSLPSSRVIETTTETNELTKKKSVKKRWVTTESTYQADISLQNYDWKLEPTRFLSWSRLVRIHTWVHGFTNDCYMGKYKKYGELSKTENWRSWKLKTKLSVTCKRKSSQKNIKLWDQQRKETLAVEPIHRWG